MRTHIPTAARWPFSCATWLQHFVHVATRDLRPAGGHTHTAASLTSALGGRTIAALAGVVVVGQAGVVVICQARVVVVGHAGVVALSQADSRCDWSGWCPQNK